jgi:hypothetical protein
MNDATSPPPESFERKSRFRVYLERLGFWTERRELLAAILFFVAAGVFHLSMAVQGWNLPLLDAHGFRQTQTAYSAKVIRDGGPWLAYETPVLGPPWAIPMEFPLYQWIVAATSYFFGLPIDPAGRIVGLVMTWLTLVPLEILLRQFGLRPAQRLLVAGLYLFNPIYIFWGRAVLIETTAVFFSMLLLALGAMAERSPWRLVGAALCGAVAAMMKITTLLPYLLVLACLLAGRVRQARYERSVMRAAALRFALISVVALGSGLAWTRYADRVKEANPIAAATLRSETLLKWTFGPLEQRLELFEWGRLAKHVVLHGIGWALPAFALLAVVAVPSARRREAAACLAGAVAAPLVFMNLYVVHNYYSAAIELLLVLAVGLVVGGLVGRSQEQTWAGFAACVLGAVQMTSVYCADYLPVQTTVPEQVPQLAEVCKQACSADKMLVVIGRDWSPELPYYAKRRALMIGAYAPELAERVLNELDPANVGAVVVREPRNPQVRPYVELLNASRLRREWSRAGWNEYVAPDETIVVPSPESGEAFDKLQRT